jgi:hypothetical protein
MPTGPPSRQAQTWWRPSPNSAGRAVQLGGNTAELVVQRIAETAGSDHDGERDQGSDQAVLNSVAPDSSLPNREQSLNMWERSSVSTPMPFNF